MHANVRLHSGAIGAAVLGVRLPGDWCACVKGGTAGFRGDRVWVEGLPPPPPPKRGRFALISTDVEIFTHGGTHISLRPDH